MPSSPENSRDRRPYEQHPKPDTISKLGQTALKGAKDAAIRSKLGETAIKGPSKDKPKK